ncbi:MAG: PEP-CTERM sorting domain-containing protein [Myxococcota bacterium]
MFEHEALAKTIPTRHPRSRVPLAAAIALLVGVGTPAMAATVVVDAVTSGFFKESGNSAHIVGSTIENYQAGYNKTTDETAKNWFVFDVPTLGPDDFIADAALSLYLPTFPGDAGFGYGSADPEETYTLFTLDAPQLSVIDADLILGDLATGSDFDTWYPLLGATGDIAADGPVVKADEGTEVIFPFTMEGLMYLDGSIGGTILFGGLVSSIDNDPSLDIAEGLFHHTHPGGIGGPATPSAKLILDIVTVPEPGTGLLIVFGLAGMAVGGGRRR